MPGPKVVRRDLKEDKVYVTIAGVADFVARNRLALALGVLVVVLLFAFGYYWAMRSQRRMSEASFALYQAEKIEDASARSEAYENVAKEFPGSAPAAMARYQRANLLYEEGKYEEARQAYVEFLTWHPNYPAAPAAMEAIGYCYESLGKWKEAAGEYDKLQRKYPAHPAAKRVMYRVGLCYEKLGDIDKAAEAYRKTADLLPESLWAEYAEERLASLRPNEEGIGEEPAEG